MFTQAQRVVRILTADDHPIARRGMRELLAEETDLEVVAELCDAASALSAIAELTPDVAILDLFMPGGSVLDLLPELIRSSPATAVIIVTMEREPTYARKALAAGASGYVLKDGADEELVDAIRAVLSGDRYVNARLAARLATEDAAIRPGGLSPRQLEILKMLALGYTNTQIGERLFLSVRTVETHRAHIQQKLDVHDRHGLVAFALSHGLVGATAA